MSNYSHYADMSYPYDPTTAQQVQSYDQFYDNVQPATGEMQTPNNQNSYYGNYDDPYANEPPLLEELEINLDQIVQKTWAVLTFKSLSANKNILHDPDLAGPLVFLLTFGFLLLLTGKMQFGYIYGVGVLGSLSIYTLLNLMSEKGIDAYRVVSVLGYCLLPMVAVGALSVIVTLE